MKSIDVIETLVDLFLVHGIPIFIRSDNSSEFIAKALRSWLSELNVKTLFIEPGSPWDELPDRELFYTLKDASTLIDMWRKEYSHIRPHSSLGGKPPIPLTILPSYEVQKKIYGLLT